MTLLNNTYLMHVDKSFLGIAREGEVRVNEVSWLRKEDFLMNEDSSAEGAVHQRTHYPAR